MTTAMILPSVEQWEALEHGWLWLRAERVRQVNVAGPWVDATPEEWEYEGYTKRRERLVSPTIPENLWPRTCEGDGRGPCLRGLTPGSRYGIKHVLCGGSGLVAEPFLVGVEQCLSLWGWEPWQGSDVEYATLHPSERRQALLAEVRLTGQPIPVVDEHRDVWIKNHPSYVEHVGLTDDGPMLYSEKKDGWDWHHRPFDEPWAQGLAVGDLLAEVTVEKLAEPVVDQPCPIVHGDDGIVVRWGDYQICDSCGGAGFVPLSLVPGTWGQA